MGQRNFFLVHPILRCGRNGSATNYFKEMEYENKVFGGGVETGGNRSARACGEEPSSIRKALILSDLLSRSNLLTYIYVQHMKYILRFMFYKYFWLKKKKDLKENK